MEFLKSNPLLLIILHCACVLSNLVSHKEHDELGNLHKQEVLSFENNELCNSRLTRMVISLLRISYLRTSSLFCNVTSKVSQLHC